MENKKVCSGGPTLIFSCSGAADVGGVSDLAARKLTQEGVGSMFCLAGVGGRVDPIMEKTRSASQVLAIDGCGLDCVKKTLELAEIPNVKHLRVTDLTMEKGKSPATEENIEVVVTQARAMLQG
ncbi:MAG: zinc-binding protein [Phycisphaeraceae bacterium]|nr:zinc-binding protein [Phycisphaeraceae bacterium]